MTVVVGTAGHIDHGKTALLRALTGMDADRLPEERRRGMTIDVGYVHLGLPDGNELDFVDVPGHDRLVGNMLVGAGEIDAAMLVVAADDGPRAQTLEHLELLDALGLRHGIAIVTKIDVADAARVAEVVQEVEHLLAGTSLAGSPVLAASSTGGTGIDTVLAALIALRDRVLSGDGTTAGHGATAGDDATTANHGATARETRSRLAIDRVFTIKGRGLVVTGTLRGAPLDQRATLRLLPGKSTVRARELQVHGQAVGRADRGRLALNLAGTDAVSLQRGMVLSNDPAVVATDRILVRMTGPVPDRTRARLHLGTASVDVAIGRAGWDAIELPGGAAGAILRLAAPIAAAPGDRFVLRRASGAHRVVGGFVLDVSPPRAISRRRQSAERVAALAGAIASRDDAWAAAARLDLHGAVRTDAGGLEVAEDVAAAVAGEIHEAVRQEDSSPDETRSGLGTIRALAARALRRRVALHRVEAYAAGAAVVDRCIADGTIVRDGERLRPPGTAASRSAAPDPAIALAMDLLVRAVSVPAPPSLAEAARTAGCPDAGIRELERSGRIVILDADLAYAAATYRALEKTAVDLASEGPLTPATLRDATGTSRKYVMALLADLDRRGVLCRTEAGHVPGPRAGRPVATAGDARHA